jgi:probable phosphoglycerate mutase
VGTFGHDEKMSASGTNLSSDLARIVLIRHGESASNAGGWLSGQDSCGGLTPLGVAQAEALRARLSADSSIQPDRIMVSTMPRAVHTAEIVADPTGREVEQFADLMERTSGEAEGLTVAEYTQKYGKAPWTDWENPLSPGGESGADFTARVTTALDRVVGEAWGKTIWVVCHGGVIMATAVRRWAGAAAGGPVTLSSIPLASPMNTSLSEWIVDRDDNWKMARYNDHSHLVGLSSGPAPVPI